MVITPKFTTADIEKQMSKFVEAVADETIEAMKICGETAVSYARNDHKGNWHDVTGNLRSSVGYGIYEDGKKLMESDFKQISPKVETDVPLDGGSKGRELNESIGNRTKGLALVVVAGMNYAHDVESRGNDVITGAEVVAKQELTKQITQLIENIKKV